MIETIVTVVLPDEAKQKDRKQWWADVLIATFGASKWKAIIADNVFAIASDVGTFILNNTAFASGMMCEQEIWEKDYETELKIILGSINPNVKIASKQITIN